MSRPVPQSKIRTKHLSKCLQCKEHIRLMTNENFCSETCRKRWVRAKVKKDKNTGFHIQINEKTWIRVEKEEDIPATKAKWDKILGDDLGTTKFSPVNNQYVPGKYIKKKERPDIF